MHAAKVLKRIGIQPEYAGNQVCCGQPFFKAGHWSKSIPMARTTIRALEGADTVVAPSGSCMNMIRHHYPELFRDDPRWLRRAERLAGRTYEFSEFLVRVAGVEDIGASFKGKVTYHDSCQVKRGLGIWSEPRRLLGRVKGLQLVEMESPDACCGFGGIFSFKFPEISGAMAASKIDRITAVGPNVVAGCEMSCLMHIGGHLKARGIPVRALHLADILAQGY